MSTVPIELQASVDLDLQPEAVWSVVSDFGRDPDWRHGVVSMVPDPPGPSRVGTTIREELRLLGSTYLTDTRVDAVALAEDAGGSPQWQLRFSGGSAAAGVEGVRTVRRTEHGCRFTEQLLLRPHGVQRVFAPLTARVLGRSMRGDVGRLATVLAGSGAREPGSSLPG